jgi:hypothetical protein
MKLSPFLLLSISVFVTSSTAAELPIRELTVSHGGTDQDQQQLPPALAKVYDEIATAITKGDVESIGHLSVPNAIKITYEPRKTRREFGEDINLPFAKATFSREILTFRRDGDCCWLIRTATTALSFVQIATDWRLYRYIDKPID